MDNVMIKVLDDNGNLVEHKILFSFECEELNKSYVAFEGKKENEICVASYDPEEDFNKLEPVTDEEELKMVNDVLNQIMED